MISRNVLLAICRIRVRPIDYAAEVRQPAGPKIMVGEAMRKLIVIEFITLDGVIQAGGGPEEDTSGGFAYGG